MTSISAQRLFELKKLTARIFASPIPLTQTKNSRNGSRILLKKPSSISIGSHYPSKEYYEATKVQRLIAPLKGTRYEPVDFDESIRLLKIEEKKKRGKGAPKKKEEDVKDIKKKK
ncbi:hypothetical protein BB561_002930 [Smittium simulii]|uniref:Uncharacterized protein n=1 Tax=Smittium simulii TaxID=133385 RepID=A0A2T9YNR2_9FUNG|nr:hypothetical protein BB561_002930 [Smittium simulii]